MTHLNLSGKAVIHTSEGLAEPLPAPGVHPWSERAGAHPRTGNWGQHWRASAQGSGRDSKGCFVAWGTWCPLLCKGWPVGDLELKSPNNQGCCSKRQEPSSSFCLQDSRKQLFKLTALCRSSNTSFTLAVAITSQSQVKTFSITTKAGQLSQEDLEASPNYARIFWAFAAFSLIRIQTLRFAPLQLRTREQLNLAVPGGFFLRTGGKAQNLLPITAKF